MQHGQIQRNVQRNDEVFVKVHKQKSLPPHRGKAFRRTTAAQNKKYRAVQTTRYLKSYWVS